VPCRIMELFDWSESEELGNVDRLQLAFDSLPNEQSMQTLKEK